VKNRITDMSNQEKAGVAHEDTLILKGGGVKGLAFAGALQALEEHFEFRTFVGTSVGAVAAALLSAGATGKVLEERLRNKPFHEFLDGWTWAGLVTIPVYGGIHPGFALTNWLRDELFRLLGKCNEVYMKDLLPRRAVIYASQADRDPITFDTIGQHQDYTVHGAARCSLSIPYFFRPQIVDQQWAYDGGLLNNFPVELFLNQERERSPKERPDFLALYLGPVRPHPLKLGRQFFTILSAWIDRNDRDVVQKFRDKTIIIDTDPIGTIDFDLTEQEKTFLVYVGLASALEFLRGRGLLSSGVCSGRKYNLASAENFRNMAEQMRVEITEARKRRRKPAWRKYLAQMLAGIAAILTFFAAILTFFAAILSIESMFGPMAPTDPLQSLEALANYLWR
jgi:predicted acylesterase/phospholipase RssA